jgi:hypothetical protein
MKSKFSEKDKATTIKQAIERLHRNRLKNANDICDEIYILEAKRGKDLYEKCKHSKQSVQEALNPSLVTVNEG